MLYPVRPESRRPGMRMCNAQGLEGSSIYRTTLTFPRSKQGSHTVLTGLIGCMWHSRFAILKRVHHQWRAACAWRWILLGIGTARLRCDTEYYSLLDFGLRMVCRLKSKSFCYISGFRRNVALRSALHAPGIQLRPAAARAERRTFAVTACMWEGHAIIWPAVFAWLDSLRFQIDKVLRCNNWLRRFPA